MKASFSQGQLVTEYLTLAGRQDVVSVNQIRREFRPYVFDDKLRRYREAGEPEKYDHMMRNIKVREKRFDSEYCRLRDFCEDFHLASQQDNEVMLTYFGTLVLEHIAKTQHRDFFGPEMKDVFARVVIFVDIVDKWRICDTLRDAGGSLTTHELARKLSSLGVEIDEKGVESRIKSKLKASYLDEWKNEGNLGLPDYYWYQERLKRDLQDRKQEELTRILEDLLRVYRHVELVTVEKDSYVLNEKRYDDIQKRRFWKTSTVVKPEDFRKAFVAAYKKNASPSRPNVAIPLLRKHVCSELSIPWETFDHLTRQMATQGDEPINFSHGRFHRKWGLRLANDADSYYYASIRMTKRR